MKIIHLIQRPQLRGAETFAGQIGTVHHHRGHQVLFLALFDHHAGLELSLEGPSLERLSLNEKLRFFDLAGWRKLAVRIRSFQPDIVQANAGDTLKYAVLSRKFFGWPGHLVFRNANNISSFIRGDLQKRYLSYLLNRVDSIVSVSENCRQDLLQVVPRLRPPTKTITIGTPVDVTPQRTRAEVRAEFNISATDSLLINVGSFVPEKNHLALLRIFATLRAQAGGESLRLLLVGDGRLRSDLQAGCNQLDLTDYVHFAGYRTDVGELLFHADLMVMPSMVEGMPGVILEAMARKLPVVAAKVGGIPEILHNDVTGYVVEPTDEDTFATVTRKLLDKPQLREEIAERALHLVRRDKAIGSIADDFLLFYQKVLRQ